MRSFTPGEYIGPIQGEIVEDPEYGSDYGMELGDRTLEPAAPFRFLNHSCQPNCALVIDEGEGEDETPGEPSLWLEILSDIASGAQLTIDYAWPADSAIPCQCGTQSCRGWIVTPDELDEVVTARQGAWVAS